MSYYHDLITQKSWEELKSLQKTCRFTLIGGWAVYLYTKELKSKDIDIITDFAELPKIARNYSLSKNDRLKKYEARREEVQIDIYLPHYSNIGIPVEKLTEKQNLEGFTVLEVNYLLALKIHVLSQRGRSPKGRKDFLDIISLIKEKKCSLDKVMDILKEYQLKKEIFAFMEILQEATSLPELNLNPHYFSKMKKEILLKLR